MELERYDAGLLPDFTAAHATLWHDVIRDELARAHDFYQDQVAGMESDFAALRHRRDVAVRVADRLAALLAGWDDAPVKCPRCNEGTYRSPSGMESVCRMCGGCGKVLRPEEDRAGPVAEKAAIEEADRLVASCRELRVESEATQ